MVYHRHAITKMKNFRSPKHERVKLPPDNNSTRLQFRSYFILFFVCLISAKRKTTTTKNDLRLLYGERTK